MPAPAGLQGILRYSACYIALRGICGLKVLITGGAGFIGTHLARRLVADRHQITILDCFSPQIHGENPTLPSDLQDTVHLVRGDVRNSSLWAEFLPLHDAVVHLAAETGTGQSMYEVARYEQVNLSGTALLFEHLVRGRGFGVRRIVVASSRAIYGEGAYHCGQHGLVYPASRTIAAKKDRLFDPLCPHCRACCAPSPTPESAPLLPSSFYGLTKQVQEQMTLMFGQVLEIPSVALRYQNVYGPGQSLRNPYTGILAAFSNLAREGKTIQVFEDGEESRDFVYVDDVVEATIAALVAPLSGCHALNVGSGARTTVIDVARAINAFFGDKSEIEITGAFREGDIRHGFADLTRVSQTLGYRPGWEFPAGLRRFLEWASGQPPASAGFDHSLAEMRGKGLLHD
jgi:dTDP-L-rhamnose 4-epimerase